LNATVTGGTDGDIVEFYDGTTKLGQGALAAGKATFSWTPTTNGVHSLTAKFLSTTKVNESVSTAQKVSVTREDGTGGGGDTGSAGGSLGTILGSLGNIFGS
ncbi:hypothetical protein B2J88_52605, partial [Rhodococcus sp. SRB_17]|nr:hypothetical protein [Rhodococcus sp. SRB_17]